MRHSTYQQVDGKYFLRHITKEGKSFNAARNFKHTFHLDLLINEMQLKNFEKFKGKEPGKKELFDIPYDSTFWNRYTILKETPLEEKIIADLGGSRSLNEQFIIYDTLKKKEFERAISGQGQFDQFREFSRNHNILYLDFWASWCGPCIAEMSFTKKLAQEYKGKIIFVMLSVDSDERAWNRALVKHDLLRPEIRHYRIGPDADILKFLDVNTIPRYVLVNKDGSFFDLNAKRPSNPELSADFKKIQGASD